MIFYGHFGEFQRTRKSLGEHIGQQAGRMAAAGKNVAQWENERQEGPITQWVVAHWGKTQFFVQYLNLIGNFCYFRTKIWNFGAKIQIFQVFIAWKSFDFSVKIQIIKLTSFHKKWKFEQKFHFCPSVCTYSCTLDLHHLRKGACQKSGQKPVQGGPPKMSWNIRKMISPRIFFSNVGKVQLKILEFFWLLG